MRVLWAVVLGVVLLGVPGVPPADMGRDGMTNLIKNGGFDADLSDWTVVGGGAPVTWYQGEGYSVPGVAKFAAAGGDPSGLRQSVTIAVTGRYRLRFAIRYEKAGGPLLFNVKFGLLDEWVVGYSPDWYVLEYEVAIAQGTENLTFESYAGHTFYLDDVEVEAVYLDPGYLEYFVHRLMSERDDVARVYHTRATYVRAVEEAVAAAPREVWPVQSYATTSLATVAGQVDYSLAAISTLTKGRDVLNVQLRPAVAGATAYQDWEAVGFQVYDEDAVTLRFDRPWASGYEIRVLYRKAPTAPELDSQTDLDYEYLIADAMVRLLRRRPEDLSREEGVVQMQFWMQAREVRRQEAEQVRPARRAVTPYWPL